MALPPLQDILNLLPDNTQGLIEPADLRQEATVFYESISDNQAAIANRLPLTGGTLTGSLYLANDPAQLNEAATKNYVDNYALGTGFIQKIGDEMTGDLVLLPTPAGVNSAITKGYADSVSATYFNSIADTVIFTDGRNTMNANYTPSLPQSVATRQYVDDNSDMNPNNLVKNPTSDQVIEGGYGIRVSDDYTPSEPLDLATKKFTETRGDLFADGSVDMDAGYTPSQPQSIATKDYIDSLEISGGQAWSEPTDGDAIEAGKGFYSVNAGDTFTVSDTDEDISFIVTDGSNSASADNPVILEIDSALGYTFADGTTTFEIDLAGASVEFALINGVWELVNTGNIIFGEGAGANVVTLWNGLREYGGDTSDVTFSEDITAFDEISLDWAIGGGGGVQRTGTTSLSSTKIAEMIATGGTDLRWLAEVWTQAVGLTNESERIEVGLTTLTATTASPYFSYQGANANKTPQITRIRGKKQAKVYRDIELVETANTWQETQTFAKPIVAQGGIDVTGEINNLGDTNVKHNHASFYVQCRGTSTGLYSLVGAPAGWTVTRISAGRYQIDTTPSSGTSTGSSAMYATANPRTTSGIYKVNVNGGVGFIDIYPIASNAPYDGDVAVHVNCSW